MFGTFFGNSIRISRCGEHNKRGCEKCNEKSQESERQPNNLSLCVSVLLLLLADKGLDYECNSFHTLSFYLWTAVIFAS